MSIETPGAHDCGADEAPHLAGLLRVTTIFDDGQGDTVYFDLEKLPDLMREISRTKDVRGRTYRTRAATIKGWAKVRELAFDQPTTMDALGRAVLLLWLYFHHPDARVRVADKVRRVLDEHGMACLAIVRNRATGTTAASVLPRFDSGVIRFAEASGLPNGFALIDPDPHRGPVGTM